jgi:outer membrane protein TolC
MEQPVRRLWTCLALAALAIIVAGCASIQPEETVLTNSIALPEREVMPSKGLPEKAPELTAQSTLKDYLLYAALNNPGLKAAFLKWEAALEKIPQATALPDPHFTYGYFIQEMMNQHESFALEQTFPWFGKLALQGDAAAAKWRIARATKDYYPDVSVEMQGVSMMQGKDAVVAMATVNLPVWRSKYAAEVREATAKYEAFLRERTDRENSLAAAVKFADYKYRDAERKIALYRGALIP